MLLGLWAFSWMLVYWRVIMWMPRIQANQFHGTSLHQSWAWHLRHSLQTLPHQPVQAGGNLQPLRRSTPWHDFLVSLAEKSGGWENNLAFFCSFTSYGLKINNLLCHWLFVNKNSSVNCFLNGNNRLEITLVLLLSCCGAYFLLFRYYGQCCGFWSGFGL